jgi:hypothetical protein
MDFPFVLVAHHFARAGIRQVAGANEGIQAGRLESFQRTQNARRYQPPIIGANYHVALLRSGYRLAVGLPIANAR